MTIADIYVSRACDWGLQPRNPESRDPDRIINPEIPRLSVPILGFRNCKKAQNCLIQVGSEESSETVVTYNNNCSFAQYNLQQHVQQMHVIQ